MNIENEVSVLEAIATHRAVALIGSGPSCEMGYPSWLELAKMLGEAAKRVACEFDVVGFEDYVKKGEYPEAIRAVERSIGREELCRLVALLLKKGDRGEDTLYKSLARLPFACYLTTNFDDELQNHLNAVGRRYSLSWNRKEDFFTFRDDMQDIIYKIHGDMRHPDSAVLTSNDYTSFSRSPERSYFRQRLQMLFGMKRCIVIGYSLSDRDLMSIIEGLKQTSSELSPSYIFLPDVERSKVEEYAERFGIHVIPYKTKDGSHEALVKKLNLYSRILQGSVQDVARASIDSKKAASLYLFRSLNKRAKNVDLDNYTLMTVPANNETAVTFEELFKQSSIAQRERLQDSLKTLLGESLITMNQHKYRRTKLGDEKVLEAQAVFAQERRFALEHFLQQLGVPVGHEDDIAGLLQMCIAHIFEDRGDALVRSIFDRSNYTGGAMVDIYRAILPYAQKVEPSELRGAFVRAVYDFITKPTKHQRSYLVSLAQGYFLYHMMGREALHESVQREVLEHSVWYVDSNLLIPLMATGCANYKFARDLFLQIKSLGMRMIVVPSVLEEVRRHLKWAAENDPDDKNRSTLTILNAERQQNLFVDGYIRTKEEGRARSFSQYKKSVEVLIYNNAKMLIDSYGMKYENPRCSEAWDEEVFATTMKSLEERRRKTMSFRRHFQIETDAELLYAMRLRIDRNKRENSRDVVGFFSQSTLFTDEETEIRTWSGEAMFRFVQFLSPVMTSEETLQECLQNELYNVGIHFVDSEKYAEFFKDEIDLAKVHFEEQREAFRQFLQEPDAEDFNNKFKALPDIQKPIFIRQMDEKLRMANVAKIEVLEDALKEAKDEAATSKSRENATEKRVRELEEILRKRDAELETVKGENRNLKNGEIYRRIKKTQKNRRGKRR